MTWHVPAMAGPLAAAGVGIWIVAELRRARLRARQASDARLDGYLLCLADLDKTAGTEPPRIPHQDVSLMHPTERHGH